MVELSSVGYIISPVGIGGWKLVDDVKLWSLFCQPDMNQEMLTGIFLNDINLQ